MVDQRLGPRMTMRQITMQRTHLVLQSQHLRFGDERTLLPGAASLLEPFHVFPDALKKFLHLVPLLRLGSHFFGDLVDHANFGLLRRMGAGRILQMMQGMKRMKRAHLRQSASTAKLSTPSHLE